MNRAGVSILLPIYNGSLYLRDQLESLQRQSYADFEVLMMDDGSTDESWLIATEFADRDPRFKAFRYGPNRGQLAVLRDLFLMSTSEFIMFCDQDDIWTEKKVELLLRALGSNSLAYGPSILIDANGNELGETIFDHVGPPISGLNKFSLLISNRVSGHAMLARRELIVDSTFAAGGLYDWKIAVAATFARGIAFVEDAVTLHRMHANNQTNRLAEFRLARHRRKRAKRAADLLEIVEHLASNASLGTERSHQFKVIHDLLSEHERKRSIAKLENGRVARNISRQLKEIAPPDGEMIKLQSKIEKITRAPLNPAYLWQEYMRS